jgi:hypothetical protein
MAVAMATDIYIHIFTHISILYYNYPYNISIHAVLHLDVECCQFHELESFESAQQMLGKT